MEQDTIINSYLVNAFRNLFGEMLAERMMKHLEQENAIQENGAVNTEKLEPALRNLFGPASFPILNSLLMVQKKSFAKSMK
jgi:hypothetical protein